MNSLGPPSAVSLFSLSNELLLEIIDHVALGQSRNPKSTPLKTLSLVNRHFRELVRPVLLRSVMLVTEFDSLRNEYSWYKMDAAFAQLHSSANLTKCVRKLQINLLIFNRNFHPSAEPAYQTVNLLVQLSNLEHLHLQIPEAWNYKVEEALEKQPSIHPLGFPKVTSLVIEQSSVFLLKYFPQTRRLGLSNHLGETRLDMIPLDRYSAYAPHVIQIEAVSSWKPLEASTLARCWPNITHLGAWPTEAFLPGSGWVGYFEHLEVLGMAELLSDHFWAAGVSRVFDLLRDTETVCVVWDPPEADEEADEDESDEDAERMTRMLFKEFMHEHFGYKIFQEAVENLFSCSPGLGEIWYGDMVGARQVGKGEDYDFEEEFVSDQGVGFEREWWTLRFKWLGDYFHRPGEERRQFDWLLRPIHFAGVNSKQ